MVSLVIPSGAGTVLFVAVVFTVVVVVFTVVVFTVVVVVFTVVVVVSLETPL